MYLEALSKLANEFEDFNVVKINTTKYPTLKANYNITEDTYTLDSISNLPISFRIRY